MTIFTIGHSHHPLGHLVSLLRLYDIEIVADVRSQPFSKWAPQYVKEPLQSALTEEGFRYVFLGRALGGRPEQALTDEERWESPELNAALSALLDLARAHPTVLLCAEEDPTRCHRDRLLAPALLRQGAAVTHIRGDGRTQPAIPRSRQLDLF